MGNTQWKAERWVKQEKEGEGGHWPQQNEILLVVLQLGFHDSINRISKKAEKAKMSKYNRPVFSRPRTKVYDTNYNIGESYYKSALDGIDRKYGRIKPRGTVDDFFGMPTTSQPSFERHREFEPRRTRMRDVEDDYFEDFDKRTPASNAFREFDVAFEGRMKNGMLSDRLFPKKFGTLEDEIDEDMASSLRKLKTVKFAKNVADEFEENAAKEARLRSNLDFSDKVMDSVGLTGRARASLEEEGIMGKKKILRMMSDSRDAADELTKWTALKPTIPRKYMLEDEDEAISATTGAAMRAKKSRARLENLETEMQALSERSAAREKRVRDLKALVQENEANAMDNLLTTVRVQSSIQSEKKLNF